MEEPLKPEDLSHSGGSGAIIDRDTGMTHFHLVQGINLLGICIMCVRICASLSMTLFLLRTMREI